MELENRFGRNLECLLNQPTWPIKLYKAQYIEESCELSNEEDACGK